MNPTKYDLPIPNLLLILSLTLIVVVIYARWTLKGTSLLYAIVRMVSQLGVIGFALVYIFNQRNRFIICLILFAMLLVAGWIALRPIQKKRKQLFPKIFVALLLGGGCTLIVVIGGVIQVKPWFDPQYLIPLGGMIFSSAMNSVSLAAERFETEIKADKSYVKARAAAFETSLLPTINTFFAVGLVSFPGLMTGQILTGTPPLIAVRYQIMVLSMILVSSGISTAIYLALLKNVKRNSK